MAAFDMSYITSEFDVCIISIDATNKHLYYGDNNGTVYAFEFAIKKREVKMNEIAKVRIAKVKIDCIKAFNNLNFLAVLFEGRLVLLDSTTLQTQSTLSNSEVTCFAISDNDEIAIATGKKLVTKFYDPQTKKFCNKAGKESAKVVLPEIILKMTWNNNCLGITHKKTYAIFKVTGGEGKELCNFNNTLHPNIAVSNEGWLLLNDESVSFYNRKGKSLNKRIELTESSKVGPVISMLVMNDYLLLYRKSKVEIFDLRNLTKVQEINFELHSYNNAVVTGENIILVMDSKIKKDSIVKKTGITYMSKIPIDDQIEYLLATSKVSEAREVLALNYSNQSDYMQRKETFEVDAGWTFIINLEFKEAIDCFSNANYDPRDLLTLIPEVLDEEYKSSRYITLQMLISKKQDIVSNKIEEGIDAIIILVRKQHDNLLGEYNERLNSKMKFVWPSLPMNDHFKGKISTLREVLSVIQSSLIRLYLMKKDAYGLKEFIDSVKALYVDYEEFERYLKTQIKNEPSNSILHVCHAILHEKQQNHEEALRIWKNLISPGKGALLDLGCKAMVDILRNKVKDKKIIQDYARFLLVVNLNEGLRIFIDNPNLSKIMNEDEVYNYLERQDQYRHGVKQQYLEYLVDKPDTEERFFTFLGLHYIKKVEEAKKLEDSSERKDDSEVLSRKYRDTLRMFLKTYSTYSVQTLLAEIKKLNLFDEEIAIYWKQGAHSKVIEMLVQSGKDKCEFSEAENYCLQQSEPLLDELFEKVLELYISKRNSYLIKANDISSQKGAVTSTAKNEVESLKVYMRRYEEYCKEFVTRYAANEKMNAVRIIKLIPAEWNVKEELDDILFSYLVLTLNDRINKNMNTDVARRISEAEKLELEEKRAQLKKSYVMLTGNSKCNVCNDFLSMKTFYVYPNGEVTHMKCAKDLNICPVTNIDFTNIPHN